MLAREHRLTEKRLYTRMFREGVRVKGQDFSLVVMSAGSGGKIGFIVTKKNEKSAVGRNRLKRRLRAAFLRIINQSPYQEVAKKYHIIVVTHRNCNDVPFEQLIQQVKKSLDRIGTITTKPAYHGPKRYGQNNHH